MNGPICSRIRTAAKALACAGVLLALPHCTAANAPASSRDMAQRESLAPFFKALEDLEEGRRTQPVRILQIGDEHTAGDRFSGRLRARFQERFGNAGRGMLPPGVPFEYYAPTGVATEQTGPWSVHADPGSAEEPVGLSGVRLSGGTPGTDLSLYSEEGFDRAELELLLAPEGGTLLVQVDDGVEQRIGTRGLRSVAFVELDVPPGSHRLDLRPVGDGPIEILSWTVEREGTGIVLDSHGVLGATAAVMDTWDRSFVAAELARRRPDLILLSYGTNEGFDDGLDLDDYRRRFQEAALRFAELAPWAAIYVIGPPDGNRYPDACPVEDREAAETGCAPLSDEELADYAALLETASAGGACRWHPPPNLEPVRKVQEAVAAADGYAYWDWSAVMEGACGIDRWTRTEPPLALENRVHLRPMGYEKSADALFDRIMADYALWRAARLPAM